MAYTDATLGTGIKVKATHVKEIASLLTTLASNAKISSSISLSGLTYNKISVLNMKLLQTAINTLEANFSKNCCQANCCQTCQSSKCQSCQKCQTCQKTTCQSSSCQSCQK